MINPFIQSPQGEKQRQMPTADQAYMQMYEQAIADHSQRPAVGLWVGRLLIRMGEKLTKQEPSLKSSRQHA